MKKLLIGAMALSLMSTAALADGYYHRGHGGGYGGGYRGGNGGNWVAPLVGGLIIGGVLGSMNYGYARQYPAYHTECETAPVYDRYGRYLGDEQRCYNVPNY
jgi:opacity protein-like surface antigen